jgi:hypothetical protein
MNKKILHLTIMKKWFDEIACGKKKIEYREIKPYWTKRLFDEEGNPIKYSFVLFRNGYSKNCPKMLVEFKGLKIGKEYEILLGEIIEKN